jgi:NhaP-type Na+/H+ or K+/H+ antiporter
MIPVLAFAVTLLLAVLLSSLAQRSVLSTAVLFLVAGFVLGDGVLEVIHLNPEDPVVARFTELALFSVLFTDGMRVDLGKLREAWSLPGRALLIGMPLTILATAALGRWVAGLPWTHAFLVSAALAPTDPVFASALVGREEVPRRLRGLLNVESGLNDGLALPVVVVLLAIVSRDEPHLPSVLGEVALGVVVGIAVPWVALRLERSRFFGAAALYEPLNAFAIGLLVLAIASLLHANTFLAAFSAGITVAAVSPRTRDRFHEFGDLLAELLKLAALMILGALISPQLLASIPLSGYLFTALVLVLARPTALAFALFGTRMPRREWVAAAWFGPKGFASVFFALLIRRANVDPAHQLTHLIALVITASIVLHSSTDVLVARWFHGENEREVDAKPGTTRKSENA